MSQAVGFFTDTSVCIGCKACQVACHQWNELPAENGGGGTLTGHSYDNTGSFSDVNWRHVKFIEQISEDRSQAAWLMMSDVCKHCAAAPCRDVCPTDAIIITEFNTVFIRESHCNGCRDCIAACPFGVIRVSETKHIAQKCTFCYDRLQNGLTPACAQACPTQSIQFGPLDELRNRAAARVSQLHERGVPQAKLYGADEKVLGGLSSFYLLLDEPEVYGLPAAPQVPSQSVARSSWRAILAAAWMTVASFLAFRHRP